MLEGTLRVLRCIQGVRLFANLCKFIEEMLNIFFFFCQGYTFGNSWMGGGGIICPCLVDRVFLEGWKNLGYQFQY